MTELQRPILDFIHAHHETRQEAPSTRDVLQAFRYRNEASVLRQLEALAAAGHVTRKNDRWELAGPQVQLHFGLNGNADAPAKPPPQ